ncbi:MAG TPA: hypothetical protein VHY32_08200, partial [Caulobacteraceae bacterium]|nr:hypothetical protein [Caulobacteraceae bacterium]
MVKPTEASRQLEFDFCSSRTARVEIVVKGGSGTGTETSIRQGATVFDLSGRFLTAGARARNERSLDVLHIAGLV